MRDLRADEKHRGPIRARRRTSSAADARRRFHREIRAHLPDRQRIPILRRARAHADESARLLDAIERAAIHAKIADDLERLRAKRLDEDRFTVLKFPHVELAGRRLARPMRDAIDRQRTSPANALAAIVIECDGLLAFREQVFIHDVQHFEKRCVGGNIARFDIDKAARGVRGFLTPDFEVEIHVGSEMENLGKLGGIDDRKVRRDLSEIIRVAREQTLPPQAESCDQNVRERTASQTR